jgi:WD40 repeat protein
LASASLEAGGAGYPYVGDFRLWDVATGGEILKLQGYGGGQKSMAFSPDGKVVAVAPEKHVVQIRESATGKPIRTLRGPAAWISVLGFSPDGRILAAVDETDIVHVWDVSRGKRTRTLQAAGPKTASLAFSPDGKQLAVWSPYAGALWEAETGKQIAKIEETSRQEGVKPVDFFFSPQVGALAATAGSRKKGFQLWDVASGRTLVQSDEGGGFSIPYLTLSPDGKMLAAAWYGKQGGGGYNRLRLWSLGTGKALFAVETGVRRAVFAPDGKTLATYTYGDTSIRLWDVATGKERLTLPGHRGRVDVVAFSPDGKTVATGSGWGHEEAILVWDRATSRVRRAWRFPWGSVRAVAFSNDGRTFAELSGLKSTLWDLASGSQTRAVHTNDFEGRYVALSPDGRYMAASRGIRPERIGIWKVSTGNLSRDFEVDDVVSCAAFSPDSKTLATAGRKGIINLWRVATGKCLPLQGHKEWVPALAFSRCGRRLVSAGGDGTVRLWDVATRKELLQLRGHAGAVWGVAICPSGRLLASAGEDRTIRLWDVAAGNEVYRFEGHEGAVVSLAFSPDGKTLISGSRDTTVLAWDVAHLPATTQPRIKLAPGELKRAWADLAQPDAATAYQALWKLARADGPIEPFLREQLQRLPRPDAQRVARLIADLDSDSFAVREKALSELERLGAWAEPVLRHTLAGKPPLEVQRRVEALLERLDGGDLGPSQACGLWALEALQERDTPEAKNVLATLARGSPEDWLTQVAKAALERAAGRPISGNR